MGWWSRLISGGEGLGWGNIGYGRIASGWVGKAGQGAGQGRAEQGCALRKEMVLIK